MDSHHEERINELLDNIRADESHNLNDGSGHAGPSNQNKQMNPGYRRKDDGPSACRDWYNDVSEKWSLTDRKDGMSSGSDRSEAGPSTARDWLNTSPQWRYQKDELSLDEGKVALISTQFLYGMQEGKGEQQRTNTIFDMKTWDENSIIILTFCV